VLQASWLSTGEGLACKSLRTLSARAMMHTQVTASDKYAEVPVCHCRLVGTAAASEVVPSCGKCGSGTMASNATKTTCTFKVI